MVEYSARKIPNKNYPLLTSQQRIKIVIFFLVKKHKNILKIIKINLVYGGVRILFIHNIIEKIHDIYDGLMSIKSLRQSFGYMKRIEYMR